MDHLSDVLSPAGPLREDLGERAVVCDQHGPYTSHGWGFVIGKRREFWSKCPRCLEVEEADKARAEVLERADKARARHVAMLGSAAVPKRFHEKTFDSFKADTPEKQQALGVASSYAERFSQHAEAGDGLIFSGRPGTGKSHLALAILHHVMPEGVVGLYVTASEMIRCVRETWRKSSEHTERQVLDTFAEAPLLVIDEIGATFGTEGEQVLIFEVMDRRYREQVPTILLTNHDNKGLRDFLGDRSYDRLRETSRWVAFDWESFRPSARAINTRID